jgi:putative ABC transport system permease protein
MHALFGIPVAELAVAMAIVLGILFGALAALAIRNRVFLRLGVRNVARRPGRSALIVVGLMLGTAIIAAALATGDTMSQTIRSSAVSALGQTDELVQAKGAKVNLRVETGTPTGVRYFPQAYFGRVAAAVRGSSAVDGVMPAITESVAMQDLTSRQNEPRVTLFGGDPAHFRGFGSIESDGRAVSLATLGANEVFLNAKAADKLGATAGDTVRVLAGSTAYAAQVRAVVHYDGAGSDQAVVLMALRSAQRVLGVPGRIRAILVSNRGGVTSGAKLTGEVARQLKPVVTPLGLETDKTKQDALELADTEGASFMSIFTTFGSFSIAAGALLIFLIFVMLAAERRGELGIARAIGTRRRHLVSMFVFEGLAYDLLAAVVGVLAGIAVAYGMVILLATALSTETDVKITYSVRITSLIVAYTIGVLLTFAVVFFSAWRVSRMNISTAIRNLPEPAAEKTGRRRWLRGALGVVVGAFLAFQGVGAENGVVLGLGVAVVLLSLVPLARLAGVPDRVAKTAAGLALIAWFLLPIPRWLFGDLKTDFSAFVVNGLLIVVGATWVLMYNADVLLGLLARGAARFRGLAPVLKMSIAYPLRSLFRTAVTLAMFMLVVFTLVVGSTITGSMLGAFNDTNSFGGGFDVRADVSPAAPVTNMRAALRHAPGLDARNFSIVSSQSFLPIKAKQLGEKQKPEDYVVRGMDAAFLRHTTYKLAMRADGYDSPAAVWNAIRARPGLAVVDAQIVPHKANYNIGAPKTFAVHGFYIEDRTFAPFRVVVRDPQTGKRVTLTVIGVLSENAPLAMQGLITSQATLASAFGDRVQPTSYLFALRKGVDAGATARRLESAFLANGMQADSIRKLLHDAVGASLTFDRLIMGFMGLGLVVGVAALGVISARAVVERRQQIGVLRAIGFRRRMVQLSFLLESSFIAVTSIVVGTLLGLAVAFNIVHDYERQPGMENLSLQVPWGTLGVIFLVVYAVALATTFAPARRASRVYPAEALRYQ